MVSRIKLGIWEAEEFEQDLASRHTTFGRSTSASDMQRKGNRHSEEHNKQGEVSSRNSTDKSRICYTVASRGWENFGIWRQRQLQAATTGASSVHTASKHAICIRHLMFLAKLIYTLTEKRRGSSLLFSHTDDRSARCLGQRSRAPSSDPARQSADGSLYPLTSRAA